MNFPVEYLENILAEKKGYLQPTGGNASEDTSGWPVSLDRNTNTSL